MASSLVRAVSMLRQLTLTLLIVNEIKKTPVMRLGLSGWERSLNDFLELVVTIKKHVDALTSLRHFFASQCPSEQHALTYGGEQIAKHTKDGFTPVEWCSIGASYLLWKVNTKSEQGRKSRKKK